MTDEMTVSGHTAGPWEVVENPDSGGGDTVISNAASIYSDDETYVADVYRGYVGSEIVTHDQQLANARLIAAAPELLEALIDCRRALELSNFTDELAVVDAAIAKATTGEIHD